MAPGQKEPNLNLPKYQLDKKYKLFPSKDMIQIELKIKDIKKSD